MMASKGRPRNEATRQAVLTAAMELANERGYANVTIQDIAARAGTSRQTIYRWWPELTDIYLEVVAEKIQELTTAQPVDADLERYIQRMFAFQRGNVGELIMGMIYGCSNKRVLEVFRPMIQGRLKLLTETIAAFAEAQRSDLSVPAPLVGEMIGGSMWYRIIRQDAPLDDAFAGELTNMVRSLLVPRR